jgi:hypothetical protein
MTILEEGPKAMAKASVFWTFTSIFSCYCFARIVSGIGGKKDSTKAWES